MSQSLLSTRLESTLSGQPISRQRFLELMKIALAVKEYHFARQAAMAWLLPFPGDLPVTFLYAQALAKDGHQAQAVPILEQLCQTDPEFLEANELLAAVRTAGSPQEAANCCLALGSSNSTVGKSAIDQTIVTWSRLLGQARGFLQQGNMPQAEQLIHQTLAARQPNPLIAVTHLKILHAQAKSMEAPLQGVHSLAGHYPERWPDCLQCSLLLADSLMDGGESEKAVALLHRAAGRDVTGQVPIRLWGLNHPYKALWPDKLEAKLELQIPSRIAEVLGWNRLPIGAPQPPVEPERMPEPEETQKVAVPPQAKVLEPQPVETGIEPSETHPFEEPQPSHSTALPHSRTAPVYASVPESLRSVQNELERVAGRLNKPGLTRSDGRLPVYVVMTTRRGLETAYGRENFETIENELTYLVESVQSRRDWRAVLFYADDGVVVHSKTARPAAAPAKANDPWGLKLALADLDTSLGRKGERIGAVLIVGGPDIVPFHYLPNPVDDSDADVPSDNPYGTRDENYFIPEWPVGRLSGGTERDPAPLLHVLRSITVRHAALARRKKPRRLYSRWFERLNDWLKNRLPGADRPRQSYGYTAAVWRKASFSVFRPIGLPGAMLVSPPVQVPTGQASEPHIPATGRKKQTGLSHKNSSARNERISLPNARLAYFNLHGLEDAVEWYGQKDPNDARGASASDGPDYPVALRPQDIVNSGRAPHVVFSEACYGAHIIGKTVEQALALKFLQSGSQAVVGSTCVAYGSVSEPLIAADFLGQAFWDALRKGAPAGEALRRAKISLAHEMHHRQGYLDGEDQKTLISFVLYGDPLAQPPIPGSSPKSILRPLAPPQAVPTVCDKARRDEPSEPLPSEVMSHVKQVVEQYLPGMADANLIVNQEYAECRHAGHECPTAQLGKKSHPLPVPDRRLIVLSKQVAGNRYLHRHFARITFDSHNNLVKLAVSR